MPLRGVADVLKVKLDTVRQRFWVGAEHREKVNKLLLADRFATLTTRLKVSQVELDALWTFVKKNALRKRAMLWADAPHPYGRSPVWVVRPHGGLKLRISDNHNGLRKWQGRTPAMAAGLADHIWSFRELMTTKTFINH